jgi:hypothetical protein
MTSSKISFLLPMSMPRRSGANDNSNNNPSSNNEVPILGIKIVVSYPEPDDNALTGPLTRHAKKQWIAEGNDDDSNVTFTVNTFFNMWVIHNPFGIMLAMPSDMMHLFESGILK